MGRKQGRKKKEAVAERSKEGAEAARQSPAPQQRTTIKEAGERERPPHTVDAEPGRVLRGVSGHEVGD